MIDIVVVTLQVIGAFFMLTAAVGLLRMPDLYTRMSVNTKSVTLGMGVLLLALALHFRDAGVATRAAAVIAFIVLSVPIASHLIGRAAYLSGVQLWRETQVDELREIYPEGSPRAEPTSVLDEPAHPSEPPPKDN